jgi:hypothetical protein
MVSLYVPGSPSYNIACTVHNRHGQSAALGPHPALQLIFAALGPFSVMRKGNIDLLLPKILSKTVNKSMKMIKFFSAEIVTLSSLIWNSAARNEK